MAIACAFAKCFIAGTLLTAAGYKRIEDIVVGDKVLSYHEETGETDYKEVVWLFRNESSALCHVSIEGEDKPIISTPDHKCFVPLNTSCRDSNELLEHAGYVELSDKWVSAKDSNRR